MDIIAQYPEFTPLSFEAAATIKPNLQRLSSDMSELTVGSLYFFKDFYQYKISRYNEESYIIKGQERGLPFFFTIGQALPVSLITELYADCSYWKAIPESFLTTHADMFQTLGAEPKEDRDNFDYLYTRLSLSTLSGKQLHKKKNHVNGFLNNYPDSSIKLLDSQNKADAFNILERWANEQENVQKTDFQAAQLALTTPLLDDFTGLVVYVKEVPVAWCLAELIAQGSIAVVHFEKARTDFRGSYQYINYAFAQSLPEQVVYINREQDLGDEGLRHAKMSYKPERFVKKYRLDKGALRV